MSAARQISPISEGAPARSDNDAGSAERSLSEGKSAEPGSSPAIRRRLPDERRALTHHFSIAGQERYLAVGVYEDGSHMRFEPSGWSGDPKIGYAKSVMDYIGRWLDLKFLSGAQGELFDGLAMPTLPTTDGKGTDPVKGLGELVQMGDAPACNICGSLMVPSGTCYRCMTCGSTSECS